MVWPALAERRIFYIWMSGILGTHRRAGVCTHFVVFRNNCLYVFIISIIINRLQSYAWLHGAKRATPWTHSPYSKRPNSHKTHFVSSLSVSILFRGFFIYAFHLFTVWMLDVMVEWSNANIMPCASQSHREVYTCLRSEYMDSDVEWTDRNVFGRSVAKCRTFDRMMRERDRRSKMLQNNLNKYTALS